MAAETVFSGLVRHDEGLHQGTASDEQQQPVPLGVTRNEKHDATEPDSRPNRLWRWRRCSSPLGGERLARPVCGRRELRQVRQYAQIFGVETAALIVDDDPNRADRRPTHLEWN